LNSVSEGSLLETLVKLQERDDVLYALPDFKVKLTSEGTTYSNSNNCEYIYNELSMNECWKYTRGSSGVLVGVIDSGIDHNHPALTNVLNLNLSRNFTNGYPEFENNPVVNSDHGTHVAGIIAAEHSENNNMMGISPNISLISLKAFDSANNGYTSNIVLAIQYAIDNDIPILNLSAAYYTNSTYFNQSLYEIIDEYPGLFVCSSGNNNKNIDNNPMYPASYDLGNIICVGSMNFGGGKAEESNYGDSSVDIYTYGKDIYSTVPGGYAFKSGTSMAAPFVTGVAALLLSFNPNLTTLQLKESILSVPKNYVFNPNGRAVDVQNTYVRKLNAWESMKYVIDNYCNSLSLGELPIITKRLQPSDYFVEQNLFLKLVVSENQNATITFSSDYAFNLYMYDSDLNLIEGEHIINNDDSNIVVEFNFDAGIYYFKANFVDPEIEDDINILLPHNHNLNDHYSWNTSTRHRNFCACGYFVLEGHTILQGSNVCILCKGIVDTGFIGINSNVQSLYKSLNGSLKFANGIIILVEADVYEYLNGTLEFFKNDDVKE
jgi:subtilisin family serine protease